MAEVIESYLTTSRGKWSPEDANAWYATRPWLVGANFLPASAINQLEMWQAETFDPARIDRELALAAGIGMNTMRVFLHDLLWQDPEGFKSRLDTFLSLSAKHGIKPMLVLFDSCWDPSPQLGAQRAPTPGLHNSGWVQGPGAAALQDPSQYARLEEYVKGVVGAFARDERILCWDVWNEPDNTNAASYGSREPANKVELVLSLLPQVFAWAREANPSQPLTSGVWQGDWSADETLTPMWRVQLLLSDVISFHNYECPEEFERRLSWLSRYGRPILCTEYMARGQNSTFQGILPLMKKHRVGAYNWGFVAGKSQTLMPWDSWQNPYTTEPQLWFHDIFREDCTCYCEEEVAFIKEMTGVVVVVPRE